MIQVVIKGELTDLNTYIKRLNSHYHSGNNAKQAETDKVYWECMNQKTKAVTEYPVKITFEWYSKDQRKDIDNVAFAKKYILDGLVRAHVLENDSRKYVNAFEDKFFIDKKYPRVEVTIQKNEVAKHKTV